MTHKKTFGEAIDQITKAIKGAPGLHMRGESYHYENRTSGSGKNRKTRRVKVTTHVATETYRVTKY